MKVSKSGRLVTAGGCTIGMPLLSVPSIVPVESTQATAAAVSAVSAAALVELARGRTEADTEPALAVAGIDHAAGPGSGGGGNAAVIGSMPPLAA